MFKLKLSIDPVQVKLKSTVFTAVPRKVVIQRRNSVLNNFGEELWVILPSHCELQSNNARVPLKNSYGKKLYSATDYHVCCDFQHLGTQFFLLFLYITLELKLKDFKINGGLKQSENIKSSVLKLVKELL